MKFFDANKKILHNLGIQDQPSQQSVFNLRNSVFLSFLAQLCIFTSVFLLSETMTMKEYANSFYVTITTLTFSFMYTLYVWNTTKMFELINGFEQFAEKCQ